MMFRSIAMAVALLLLRSLAAAQDTLAITGSVKDSVGHALTGATVTLIKTSSGAGLAFARTDVKGHYKFTLPQSRVGNEAIAVKVTYVGFVKAQQSVAKMNEPVHFILKQEPSQLQEVKVVSKIYVVQKSDTISFNADLFRDSTDRVLGDLIRKIPGIEVDDNGTIKYNGKALNNFYIEGDDLLDGRYNLATNNIPSKYVDKVEVIEHNQHIKMLNGVVQSDEPALNIRLKDKSKLKWINNADLAAGTPKRYNGKVSTMAFKPKIKSINAISANNIGNDLSNELHSHYSNSGIASPFIDVALSRPAGIAQNRYLFNKNQMVNVNNLVHLRKGNTLRLNAYYLHDERPFSNNSTTTYILPGKDTISYAELQNSFATIHQAQATLAYGRNTEKNYFNESLLADISTTKNTVDIATGNALLLQQLNTRLNSFANNLNGVLTVGKRKRIVTYNSAVSYSRNPQRFTVSPGWLPDLLNDGNSYQQSLQQTNLPTWKTNNNLSLMVRKNQFLINNQLGVAYENKQLKSDIDIQEANGWLKPDSFTNRMRWHKADIYYLPNFQWEHNRSRLNIDLPLHYYDIGYTDNVAKASDKLSALFVTPGMGYNLRVGKEHELAAGYRFGNTFSDMNEMYAVGIMQSYRSVQSYFGTPIKSGYSSNYNARFAFKRTLKMFFWNINASYVASNKDFMYGSTVTNTSYQIITLPIANKQYTVNLSGDISKYIFPLKTNITARVSMSRASFQQYQNEVLFTVGNWQNSYSLELAPRLQDWVRIDLKANYITGTSSSKSAGFTDQKTSQLRQTTSLFVNLSTSLTLQTGSEYFASYLNGEELAKCLFVNSYINYRIIKKDINLRLSCNNMANERQFTVITANSNVIATRNYLLQPRTLLLSIAFKF